MRAVVWVKFTSERFHRWPDAPEDALHAHLRSEHRHLFHVEVSVEVTETERQVSFESLRAQAIDAFDEVVPLRSEMSCELMALLLAQSLAIESSLPVACVTVSEDNEAGASVLLGDIERIKG